MYDIARRDRQVFIAQLAKPSRIMFFVAMVVLDVIFWPTWYLLLATLVFSAAMAYKAHRESIPMRFYNKKFLTLWTACEDRLKRFHEAHKSGVGAGSPELLELPRTVESVFKALYMALRKADIVMHEVVKSEGWLIAAHQPTVPLSPDHRAQELYRLADKNVADYRQHYKGVMAGVERTEAQAAFFTTTLDSLRIRMLEHRLTGRSPELEHKEFLQSMTEAKMQLDAIDKALEELEALPFPGEAETPAELQEKS